MKPRFNVVVFADKGGVGKTTTTVNLAGLLSNRGYKVLIVDMDTRGDCATSLGIPPAPGVFQWFGDDPDFPTVQREQVVKPTRFQNLEILPGNRRTETLNAIYNQEGVQLYTVSRRLETLTEGYDFVLFDSTPASGLLRDAAFQCAHVIIIPAKTEYLGFGEIGPVLERLSKDQRAVVLPTMYDARESVQQGVLISIQQRWPKSIIPNGNELPLCIPDRTDVRQASFARQTLFEYAPKSEATRAYMALTDSVVDMTMRGSWCVMAKNKFVITDENMPVASDTTIGAGIIEQPEVTLRYDYSLVPEVDRDELMATAIRIKQLDSRASRHIWQIGKELVEHKQYVPHGQWLPWLDKEFDYSDTMAQGFMNTYRKFPNFGDLQGLGRSVLGLLAAGTTPPEIVDAVVEEAKLGNPPTFTEVKKRISAARGRILSPPSANGAGVTSNVFIQVPVTPPPAEVHFVSSAESGTAYTVDVDRITEAQTWVVVFRQAINLLSDYAARTGDDYHSVEARRHLLLVIERLEQNS